MSLFFERPKFSYGVSSQRFADRLLRDFGSTRTEETCQRMITLTRLESSRSVQVAEIEIQSSDKELAKGGDLGEIPTFTRNLHLASKKISEKLLIYDNFALTN